MGAQPVQKSCVCARRMTGRPTTKASRGSTNLPRWPQVIDMAGDSPGSRKESMRLFGIMVALCLGTTTVACATVEHKHPDLARSGHNHTCGEFDRDSEAWKMCRLQAEQQRVVAVISAGEGSQTDIRNAHARSEDIIVALRQQADARRSESAALDHVSRQRSLEACKLELGEGHPDCTSLSLNVHRLSTESAPIASATSASATDEVRLIVSGFSKSEVKLASVPPKGWTVDVDRRRRTLAVAVNGVIKGHLSGKDEQFVSGSCYAGRLAQNGELVWELCPADAEALPETPPVPTPAPSPTP